MNDDTAIKIIDQSIENGWKGFFEVHKEKNDYPKKEKVNAGILLQRKYGINQN